MKKKNSYTERFSVRRKSGSSKKKRGYRIVGPTEAVIEFAQPLLDIWGIQPSQEKLHESFHIADLIWNIAVSDNPQYIEDSLEQLKTMYPEKITHQLIDEMLERHRHMFPTLKSDPPLEIHIYPAESDDQRMLFNESTVTLSEKIFPPSDEERRIIQALWDSDEKINQVEGFEKSFTEVISQLYKWYKEWCRKKGIGEDLIEKMIFSIDYFLTFLYRYEGVTLKEASYREFDDFLNIFWIRRTFISKKILSIMVFTLKCFYLFLQEKQYLKSNQPYIQMIQKGGRRFLTELKKMSLC